MEPELIADYECVCGEGPIWHPQERLIYWTDIETGRMFRYDPASGHHEQFYTGEIVGGFTIQVDGALLLFGDKGSIRRWNKGELTTVLEEIPEERDSRFNDVIADPKGRVFCGTMSSSSHKGRLYRLDTDGTISCVLEGILCTNGMGFTPDLKQMYYTDSDTREIFLFDYDAETGSLSNQRLFLKMPEGAGVPDGLTVDAEGYVWSAKWNGNRLVRYTAGGIEDRRIEFPAKKVSSVTFGGPDYTDLYVTTAGGDQKTTDGAGAGALFRVRSAIKGVPEFPSRIG